MVPNARAGRVVAAAVVLELDCATGAATALIVIRRSVHLAAGGARGGLVRLGGCREPWVRVGYDVEAALCDSVRGVMLFAVGLSYCCVCCVTLLKKLCLQNHQG